MFHDIVQNKYSEINKISNKFSFNKGKYNYYENSEDVNYNFEHKIENKDQEEIDWNELGNLCNSVGLSEDGVFRGTNNIQQNFILNDFKQPINNLGIQNNIKEKFICEEK